MSAIQLAKRPPSAHECLPGEPKVNCGIKPAGKLAIAKYQGSSEWGKFGILHFFTIQMDFTTPHKLVAGTTCTDKIVRDLGGVLPEDLNKLNKGDLIYGVE